MSPETIGPLQAYLERLEDLHAGVSEAIAGLPPEGLDWAPGPGMNSPAVIVAHLAGAERYWIGDVVAGDPSHRVREDEFRVRGRTADELTLLLERALDHSRAVLAGLSLADLEAVRRSPRDGRTFTVAWCLAHALEHAALHLGHLQVTRQLWENRAPA